MSKLRSYIRIARPGDREAVLHFSEHTWEWGDYLPLVWDNWLHEPSGKLMVTTIHRVPVAVAHVVIVAPGEAWFEGLRVDPAYRRKGLATRMTKRCIKEASLLGAKVIRFDTSSVNQPVHRIADKLGFAKVASLFPHQAEGVEDRSAVLLQPAPKDMPHLLSFLKQSEILSAVGGLCSSGWRFYSLTRTVLEDRLNRGMVRVLGKSQNISALAIIGPGYPGEGLVASYTDGGPDNLTSLALGLRNEAAGHVPPVVTIWLPELQQIQQVFAEAEYQALTDNPLWVYQLTLEDSTDWNDLLRATAL